MRKRTAVIAAVAVVAVGGGIAYAAWSSTGAGTGQVTAQGSVDSTITGNGGTGLYPGATNVTFTVTIDNPNPYPVKVTKINAGTSTAIGACAAGTVTSAEVLNPAGSITANGGTKTYALQATMIGNPDESCKGRTFDLPLTATLESAA
jgi:hypothetical protein